MFWVGFAVGALVLGVILIVLFGVFLLKSGPKF